MAAFVLSLPESKLRVIAPDVGGGFGSKIFLYAEDVALTWASKKIRRPVKWTAERSEAFVSDAHGRDHVTKAELAMDADGKFLAMRVHTIANMGAYLSTFASSVPTILYATLLAGQYATPAIYAEVKAVFTNTVPVDAYRGAGRPEATYVVERLVETAAREMNLDPAEIRRRNFIRTFPYATPVGLTYDTGDYETTLARALELADVKGFAARKQASEQNGKLRGLGYSCYIEACGLAPSNIAGALGARAGLFEVGQIRVHPTGSVTVFTGSHSHGQGHETTFAQVVADRLGIALESVEIVHGDTGRIPFGMGTYGSRSIAVGGSAIMKALDKIETKAKKIAAHLLEAAAEDIEFKDGVFRVAGTDRTKAFADISLAAYVPHNYPLDELEPGLEESAFYDPTNFTYPAGAYICEVEVDPDTGVCRIQQFTAVDDFGNVINPMIVEGQVHGGLASGHRPGDAGALRVRQRQRPVAVRLVHGLRDAARLRSAELHRRNRQGHAVHAQSARREGLRRSGRHRLAAGGDQRDPRRARAARRDRPANAGDAASRVVRDPRCASNPIEILSGAFDMYSFEYQRATDPESGRRSARRRQRREVPRRRPEPAADHAPASRAAVATDRRDAHCRAQIDHRRRQNGDDRRRRLSCGRRGSCRDPARVAGARGPRRAYRRPAGARARHDRRLAREQRSGRVLSGCGDGFRMRRS